MGLRLFSVKILVMAASVTACRIVFIFSRIVGHDVQMCILRRHVDLIIFVGVMGLRLFSVKILATNFVH